MDSFYKGRLVAVLGGAGFIGRALVNQLNRCDAVVWSVGGSLNGRGERQLSGPVDQELLLQLPQPPDVIFHLAGGSSVAYSNENPLKDFDRTVRSTANALDYLRRQCPAARLVYVSSAAVYGNTQVNESRKRDTGPVSPYGLHKKISVELCSFAAKFNCLNISTVRPFSVYGPGLRKQLLWDALRKVDNGTPEFFGNGSEIRDWVYVDDLAELLLKVGDGTISATADEPLDAGTGTGVSVKEVLTFLLEAYRPGMVPRFLGAEKKGDPTQLVASMVKPEVLRTLTQISLKEGLLRYVDWYRQRDPSC